MDTNLSKFYLLGKEFAFIILCDRVLIQKNVFRLEEDI